MYSLVSSAVRWVLWSSNMPPSYFLFLAAPIHLEDARSHPWSKRNGAEANPSSSLTKRQAEHWMVYHNSLSLWGKVYQGILASVCCTMSFLEMQHAVQLFFVLSGPQTFTYENNIYILCIHLGKTEAYKAYVTSNYAHIELLTFYYIFFRVLIQKEIIFIYFVKVEYYRVNGTLLLALKKWTYSKSITVLRVLNFSGSIIYSMIYCNLFKHFSFDYHLCCIKYYMLSFEYLLPKYLFTSLFP